MEITDKEFEIFQKIVMSLLGIHLSDAKRALVVSRLFSRLKQLNLNSFSEYLQYLSEAPDANKEITNFINRITTNETYFFREKYHFDFFKHQVLPKLSNNRKGEDIRIWSSACSSGEEPYSIAFIIYEFLHQKFNFNSRFKILASDVSTKVLQKAEQGIYSAEEIKKVPEQEQRKYFHQIEKDKFQIIQEIRSLVTFKNLNLMSERYPFRAQMDVIFCRNVMIYFAEESKHYVVNKFYQHLNDDGFLFIGHSESLMNYRDKFKVLDNTIYIKNR